MKIARDVSKIRREWICYNGHYDLWLEDWRGRESWWRKDADLWVEQIGQDMLSHTFTPMQRKINFVAYDKYDRRTRGDVSREPIKYWINADGEYQFIFEEETPTPRDVSVNNS